MTEDPRCCGSGTCIIDTEGRCWCGQQWDGEKMCHPPLRSTSAAASVADVAAPAAKNGPATAPRPTPGSVNL